MMMCFQKRCWIALSIEGPLRGGLGEDLEPRKYYHDQDQEQLYISPIESKAGSNAHLKEGQVLWRQSQHQDQWKNINNGQVGKDHLSRI